MANEWTSRDVLRVMKETATPSGEVSLSKVKAKFKLRSPVAKKQFDNFVEHLVVGGDFVPVDANSGMLR